MLSLFVLLYVLIIAIFKTIVFFICTISVFFDNMLNKIKSDQIKSNQIKWIYVKIVKPFCKHSNIFYHILISPDQMLWCSFVQRC